jgi:Ca2+-binding EF-hand superfamily protein
MYEFKKATDSYRVGLTDDEVKLAFGHFDKRGDGTIDYEEFLREVRVSIRNKIFIASPQQL